MSARRVSRPPKPAWWLLPMICFDRNAWVTWRERHWWRQARGRYVIGPMFGLLIRLRVWYVREGGFYWQDGHAVFDDAWGMLHPQYPRARALWDLEDGRITLAEYTRRRRAA